MIGWPGSVHDARVLSNSKIFEKGNNTLFPQNAEEEISSESDPEFDPGSVNGLCTEML